ncbi:hypothetical protein [Phenylobacterium sp.]|uniref:hypothetical protein n=1 Tax=Phenylobacterium sp. TaxID=1871053 RepID=UPI002732249D|nr:hypothetical protein [Phenylobacterium sp.]MDP1615957.1 hypothetical protein [Phenylobacterium sp.]MDP1985739.1 hypothetical protein [Phenylobacterium sp.]
MNWLGIVGDALWILSLSIMASASRGAWKRIDPQTTLPMQFARDGRPVLRLKRNIALLLVPTLGFLISLLLLGQNRATPPGTPEALILFGVRATLAGLFALVHLRWLSAALAQLDQEGALRS